MKGYMDESIDVVTILNHSGNYDIIHNNMDIDMGIDMGTTYEEMPMPTTVKDPLMSSYLFVIGITTLTLAVSIAVGILLAKRKIKKGFELYED